MSESSARRPLWLNRNFTLMWTSTAASGFGDRILVLVALALYGTYATGAESAALNARSQFFFVLPYVLFSFTAGWLADRLPRKWMLLACDEMRGLLLLTGFFMIPAIAGAAQIPADRYWQVDLILFLIGTCAATFNSVRNAIVPELVPRPQLQAANAVILTISVIFGMLAMLAAKILIDNDDRTSLKSSLLISAGLYLVSGMFFAFLHPRQHIATTAADRADSVYKGTDRRSFLYGVRFTLTHHRILSMIFLNAAIWSVAALVFAALTAIGKSNFKLYDNPLQDFFTMVGASLGFGMLFGAVFVNVVQTRRESPLLLFIGMAVSGLFAASLVINPIQWLALPLAFGMGFFGNMAIIATITLIQTLSPGFIRGRVMGITAVVDNLAMVFTYLAVWMLPGADDRIPLVLLVVGPLLAITGFILLFRHFKLGPIDGDWITNAIWRIERFFSYSYHRLEVTGKGYVPSSGAVLLASNHTVGLDPFLIQAPMTRKVRWLMTDAYHFSWAAPLWKRIKPIVLKKESGRSERVREVIRALEDGDVVGIYPEGGLQRADRQLGELQPGIVVIQRRTGVPIVPIWISGTPQAENMFWHFFKPSKSRVAFGPPFTPDKDAKPEEVLAELRKRMEALKPIVDS